MDYLDVPLQITIPKTEEGRDKDKIIILYNIQIQIGNTSTIWQVKKRYSMFHELYSRLKVQFPEILNTTNFPPKIWLKLTPEQIEQRRLGLQNWLQTVVSTTELVNTWELQYFLEIKTHLVGKQYNGKKVLVPLPDKDFDPTETAVTWKILRLEGFEVIFATEKGLKPSCDELPLNEDGVIFGQLGTDYEPTVFYREMEQDPYFRNPVLWEEVDPQDFHGMFLTGGHAAGMKQYLESKELQKKIVAFWKLKRPLAAISQGTLLLGRSRDEDTNKSLLHNRTTTTLPKYLETLGYYITTFKYGNYYKTYEISVEDEMKRYLDHPDLQLRLGEFNVLRGTAFDSKPAFYCEDGNYLSARWPGDAYLFARKFAQKLLETKFESFFAYENKQQQEYVY